LIYKAFHKNCIKETLICIVDCGMLFLVEVTVRLEAVNERLKKGEGWIGYRNTGTSGRSKFLYFSFYRNGKQLFVNTKTNDPEEAYKQLLDARGKVERGIVLPSEVGRIKYEDLRRKYVDDKPSRELSQKPQLVHLDGFFKGMKATSITTDTLREYINLRREKVGGPTIRRELTNLRAMFNLGRRERALSHDQVPYFPMPQDSLAAGQYITPDVFQRILNFLPDGTERKVERGGPTSTSNLRPLFAFLYSTACRIGTTLKLKRNNVSEDGSFIEIPAALTKTKQPQIVMLNGDHLELVRQHIKTHSRDDNPLFDSANYKEEWARACAKAGLGEYDEETHRRTGGVRIHDCRCSCAINLLESGVDEGLVLKIGGWKTRTMLDRYNVTTMTRLSTAMEKGGQYVTDRVAG
jgi:integrase